MENTQIRECYGSRVGLARKADGSGRSRLIRNIPSSSNNYGRVKDHTGSVTRLEQRLEGICGRVTEEEARKTCGAL